MDPLAIRILDEELSNLSQEILEPDIIAGCISVFNDVDRQRITRECRERSAVHGVHELILRLKKRGPKAFLQFLEALQKSQLNDTYKRLHGKAIACGLFLQESVPNQGNGRASINRFDNTGHTKKLNHAIPLTNRTYKNYMHIRVYQRKCLSLLIIYAYLIWRDMDRN